MRCLPAWLQPFLTWQTGMPLKDERPRLRWTPPLRALSAAVTMLTGLVFGAVALGAGWMAAPLLVVGWLLTTGGMRYLYVVIEHASVHNILSRSPRINRVAGEIISTLLWATPYDRFRQDHMVHHQATRTERDPDVTFLLGTGFRPGMSRPAFRRYIARTLVSPRFHLKYLWDRLRGNFVCAPYRAVMSLAYLAALGVGLSATGAWLPWLVIWFLPVTVLFQVSSLLNYHSEHRWLQNPEEGRKLIQARLSLGRFCGDPTPQTDGAGLIAWARAWSVWWLRLIFLHLPYRTFVLVGDLPQHDLHHRRPGSDWSNAAFVRRDDVAAGHPGWSEGYTDVWGTVVDHLDAVICEPRGQPPADTVGRPMPAATR